jgi:hypothetical protein
LPSITNTWSCSVNEVSEAFATLENWLVVVSWLFAIPTTTMQFATVVVTAAMLMEVWAVPPLPEPTASHGLPDSTHPEYEIAKPTWWLPGSVTVGLVSEADVARFHMTL